MLAAVLIAAVVMWGYRQNRRVVADQVRQQNRLKMLNAKERIEGYFGQIRMDLRFISLHGAIVNMTRKAYDYVNSIYEENYERHRMAEIYVIERNFDGKRRPFMTFEHGDHDHDVDKLHSLENEESEYKLQMRVIARFAEDPSLETLISEPVPLCVGSPGVVLSVPIRAEEELVGIVAGMIPSEQINRVLGRGNYHNMAVLANERGDLFGCECLPTETEAWFQEQFRRDGVQGFFEARADAFCVGKYTSLWTPLDMPGDHKWHLAFMYDEAAYLKVGGLVGAIAGWGIAGVVVLLGGTVFLLCRNLCQRIAAQAARRQSEENLAITLNSIGDAVIATDVQGRVTRMNPVAEHLTGWSSSGAAGRAVEGILRIVDEQSRAPIENPVKTVLREGAVVGLADPSVLISKDGTEHPIGNSAAPIRDARGDLSGVVLVFRDMGEERQAAEALRQAKEDAEAANQAKSDFLANMSHEIRTPMTAILGFIDLIVEGCEGACEFGKSRASEYTHTIQRNGQHLLQLINDILDLSKIEVGKLEIECIPCSPLQLVAEVESLMRVRAGAKGLLFNVEFIGDVPETIQTDPTRLKQILVNLIGNAIKFTETGGVRLVTRLVQRAAAGPLLQFDIIDTGLGIDPAHLGRLFQPFAQADASTTRRFGGTGLGLTISKRLANMLGGDIAVVDTQPGCGTRFRATVGTGPLDGAKMLERVLYAMPVDKDATAKPAAEKKKLAGRILLVEDGEDNQRLIRFVLERAGAEVEVAENGRLGADKALAAHNEGNPFDVILMDMQMPVMDGYDATSLLRRKGYTGPIVALTAHAMAEDREKCLDAGCDDYATKPIDRQALLSTIAGQLGERHTLRADASSSAKSGLVGEEADDPEIRALVEAFVGDLPARLSAIEQASSEQDVERFARLTHQLKGTAGSFGFGPISEAAAALERLADRQSDWEAIVEQVKELAALCRQVERPRSKARQ